MDDEKNNLNDAVNKVYPSLNQTDKNYLIDKLIQILNRLFLRWGGNDITSYKNQLYQNNYLDIQSLLKIIVPYIKDDDTGANKAKLRFLEEISDEHFTNIQYDRCIRYYERNIMKTINRPYYKEYIEANCQLFLETIDLCANQLYINWVDILPIVPDQLTESVEYDLLRRKLLLKENVNDLIEGIANTWFDPLPGISMNVIYQTIHKMYHSVKPCKWLIFDMFDNNGRMINVYEYLSQNLDIGLQWDVTNQNLFEQKWNELMNDNRLKNNFFYYFTKFYSGRFRLISNGILPEIEDQDPESLSHNYHISNINAIFPRIPIPDVYIFLQEQASIYHRTIYQHLRHEYIDGRWLSPKNFYNFCKSLVHTPDPYQEMPMYWSSLDSNRIRIFLSRIWIPNGTWFNITGNLRNLLNITGNNLTEYNNWIFLQVADRIDLIILQTLMYDGLLSTFVPRPSVTNISQISSITTTDIGIKKYQINEMSKYVNTNAYYYLTNDIYPRDYNKYLLSPENAFSFSHTMNWVTQLDYFHKYWNTRVIMVTGGTGTGKSTQVPKLGLYAQKMLYLKPVSRVYCTEPRITPTVNNTDQISIQLGYPIFNKNREPTGNYYVQYRHQKSSHMKESDFFIRMMTDGSLIDTLINFPFLTASNPIRKNEFVSGPLVDLVIIDEAHEHNKNMDLILTIIRDITYLNNQVKLMIVSATMDFDEARYRRYYRNINDNLNYPLSVKNKILNLDRVNVDRRIDLSRPGRSTQFKITDQYLNENIPFDKYLSVMDETILSITRVSNSGDGLAFVVGEADIRKLVTNLNQKLPADVIAFPFYSRLEEISKGDYEFIMTFKKGSLNNFTRNRSDILLNSQDTHRTVPPGTYKRIVIVATNIAEASVTFQTLKYVVDSGYVRTEIYDPTLNITVPKFIPISASSATQRRGRVGRVSDGIVYHLYTKSFVENNPIPYSITEQNLEESFLQLLQGRADDYPIVNKVNNFLSSDKLRECFARKPDGIFTRRELNNILIYADEIMDIIVNQYNYLPFYDNISLVSYLGVWDGTVPESTKQWMLNNHSDYYLPNKWMSRCHSGWTIQQLRDRTYKFYLIHPDENRIVRQPLTGYVVEIDPGNLDYLDLNRNLIQDGNLLKVTDIGTPIVSPKMEILIYYLNIQCYAYEIPYVPGNKSPNLMTLINATRPETVLVRTELVKRFQKLKYQTNLPEEYLYDWRYLAWYCYAIATGVQNHVLGLISVVKTIDSLHGWFRQKYGKIDERYLNFLNNNKNRQGDLYYAWILWKSIFTQIDQSGFHQIFSKEIIERQFNDLRTKFLRNEKISESNLTIFKRLSANNNLDFTNYLKFLTLEIVPNDQLDKLSNKIIIGLVNSGLTPQELKNIIQSYFKNYFLSQKKIWLDPDDVQWMKIHLSLPTPFGNTDWDKVLASYLRAFSTHLIYEDNGTNKVAITGYPLDFFKVYVERTTVYDTLLIDEWTSYIYHKTMATKEGLNAVWIQPFDFQWLMVLSPVLFQLLKSPRFALARTETLKRLTNYGGYDLLDSYIDILDDPVVSQALR